VCERERGGRERQRVSLLSPSRRKNIVVSQWSMNKMFIILVIKNFKDAI
jgi:hypothetical protein